MTQPAVSEALKRIRLQFHDEILIRSGRSLVTTPFAERLIPELDQILGRVEALRENAAAGNGLIKKRKLIIATGDNIILTIGDKLVNLLSEVSPSVTVQFVHLQSFEPRHLKAGDIDMAIMPKHFIQDRDINYLKLFAEDFVCISRKNHPVLHGPVRQEQLKDIPKIAFGVDRYSALKVSGLDDWEDHLSVPGMLPIPFLVAQSDSVAIVQRYLAEYVSRYVDIELHEVTDFHLSYEVGVFWGDIYNQCHTHGWLRNQLRDLLDPSLLYASQ